MPFDQTSSTCVALLPCPSLQHSSRPVPSGHVFLLNPARDLCMGVLSSAVIHCLACHCGQHMTRVISMVLCTGTLPIHTRARAHTHTHTRTSLAAFLCSSDDKDDDNGDGSNSRNNNNDDDNVRTHTRIIMYMYTNSSTVHVSCMQCTTSLLMKRTHQ
eukprot:scpid36148/ scgid28385/ 